MSRLVALAVVACLVGACARTELSIGDDPADGVDAGPETACRWTFGEPHRIGPNGGFSHGGRHDLRGHAWDGSSAWVLTLYADGLPELGEIRLHRLDLSGDQIAPPVVVAEQPILWEVYADLSVSQGLGGIVVYNGCPDSGCEAVCSDGYASGICEMGPRYVPRVRSFDRSGVLGTSRLLFAAESIVTPVIAGATGRSHVVLTDIVRQSISEAGVPADYIRQELPSYPLQAFSIPGTDNALVGLSSIDSNTRFHILGPGANSVQELQVPGASAGVSDFALSSDGQRLAAGSERTIDVVSVGGDYVHGLTLPGGIIDIEYVGELLYVIATDGPGNIEDRAIEIIAFDADGTALGRHELPHRGMGLLGTGSAALVFSTDPEDDAPIAYSARCEP